MLLNWLPRWARRAGSAGRGRGPNKAKAAFRPSLESLEDRTLLATRIWDGGGLSNFWSDRLNWVGDVRPSAGDDLVFAAGADPTSLNNTNNFAVTDFNSLTFTDSGYTLNGNRIRLGVGGITLNDQTGGAGTNIVNLPIELPGLRNFTSLNPVNSINALTLRGAISGAGGINKLGEGFLVLDAANTYSGVTLVSAGTLVLDDNNALGATGPGGNTEVLAGATLELFRAGLFDLTVPEALTLSGGTLDGGTNNTWAGAINLAADSTINGNSLDLTGVISGGGAADLTIAGSAISLEAANTYQGFTTVSGSAVLRNSQALGSLVNSTRVVGGNGTLTVVDGLVVNERLFLNGDGLGSGSGALNGGTATWAGDLVIQSDTEIFVGSGDRLTITGSISGDPNATLRKDGDGELRYAIDANENVTFAGTTLAADGVLALNTPGRNVILGSLVIDPDSDGDPSTVKLLGTFFLGIEFPGTGSNQIANNVVVVFQPGGVLDLNNHSDTVGGLNMTGGAVTTGVGTLTLAGDVISNAKDSEPGARISGRLNLGSASRTFDVANGIPGADLRIDAAVSGAAGVNLVKEGTGNLVLAGNSTFAGLTIINNGIVTAASDTALGGSGNTTVNPGGTLRLNGPAPLSIQEIIQLRGAGFANLGALLNTGNNTLTSTINVLADAVINTEAGGTLTHASNLNNVGGEPTLTKTGTGTLVFTGSGLVAQRGDTVVRAGTLVLDKSSFASPIQGGLFIGDGSASATVRLDRPNQINNFSAVTINNGTLNLNGNAETIASLDLTAGQVFAIGEPLVVNGNVTSRAADQASLVLGGLSLGDGPAGSVRTFTVEDGAAGADLFIAGTITDGANSSISLNKAGAGTLFFAGSLFGNGVNPNTYDGTTRVLDGTLQLGHADGVASVPVNLLIGDGIGAPGSARVVLSSDEQIPNPRTVVVNQDGVFDLNGNDETIANLRLRGGRVETGTGTLSVTGSVRSNADSQTALINGNLRLNAPPIFIGGFVLPGNVTFDIPDEPTNADDVVVNAVISGSSNLLRTGGTGRLVLTAGNSLTGDTILSHGILELRDGSLNTSDVIVNTTDPNFFSTVFVGQSGNDPTVTVKSLTVRRGVVAVRGSLTVLEALDFSSGSSPRARLDLEAGGIDPGQFSQIIANGGIDLGNGTTDLSVRIFGGDLNPGDRLPLLINNSNTLTVGRVKDPVTGRVLNEGDTLNVFVEEGRGVTTKPFTITYTAGDGNEVEITRNTPAKIEDVAITPEVIESGVVTFHGRLTDPDANAKLFATVDWGDGSAPETIRPGRDPFTLFHRYADDDSGGTPQDDYVVRFTWGDGSGEARSDARLVTVHNVAPVVEAGGDADVNRGGRFRRAGFFTDPGDDFWAATVNYGDGTKERHLNLLPDGRFVLRHRYARPGTYQVTVRVVDDDGGVGTDTFIVRVQGGHSKRGGGRGVGHSSDLLDIFFGLLGTQDEESFKPFGRQGRRRV